MLCHVLPRHEPSHEQGIGICANRLAINIAFTGLQVKSKGQHLGHN